jgi:hypothetical protein
MNGRTNAILREAGELYIVIAGEIPKYMVRRVVVIWAGTSKLYRVGGKTVLCYPIIFSGPDFYLSHDMALLTTDIRSELQFIGNNRMTPAAPPAPFFLPCLCGPFLYI